MEDPMRKIPRKPEQVGRALTPREQMEFAPVDVVEIRARFGQTQEGFANMLGISVDTLRNWERGRRFPVGPSRALLRIANADPEMVAHVLTRRRQEWDSSELVDVRARIAEWHRQRDEARLQQEEDRLEAAARLESETPEPRYRFRMTLDSDD